MDYNFIGPFQEVWKDVIGFENHYQVSNYGRVMGKERLINHYRGGKSLLKSQLLKPESDKDGYCRVNLCIDGKRPKKLGIHRIIAIAFIDNPENKEQVNHLNGIKYDNYIKNLEWATSSENQTHAFKEGLQKGQKGEAHSQVKLKEKEVLEIRSLYAQGIYTKQSLAVKYGVCRGTISLIITRKNWAHI